MNTLRLITGVQRTLGPISPVNFRTSESAFGRTKKIVNCLDVRRLNFNVEIWCRDALGVMGVLGVTGVSGLEARGNVATRGPRLSLLMTTVPRA